MNISYPIILEPANEGGFIVYVPDFDAYTQGYDYEDSIHMAKDLIFLLIVDRLEDKKEVPIASNLDALSVNEETHQIKLLVDLNIKK